MRSLLVGLMVIALAGSLVGGGLFAYFSDTETSTGNTFTAGKIGITLSQDFHQVYHHSVGGVDLKPCQVGYLVFTVTNVGPNPADIWKQIYDVQTAQGKTTSAELLENPANDQKDIDGVIRFDLTVTKEGAGGSVISPKLVNGELPESAGFTISPGISG